MTVLMVINHFHTAHSAHDVFSLLFILYNNHATTLFPFLQHPRNKLYLYYDAWFLLFPTFLMTVLLIINLFHIAHSAHDVFSSLLIL
jgi:hypothetical protein